VAPAGLTCTRLGNPERVTQLAADLGSFWELLAVVGIIALPTIPVTYFLWASMVSGRNERTREVASGRSSATPFGLLSIVSTFILIAAVLVTLLVIAVRAAAT
jgi:hypothetical protein